MIDRNGQGQDIFADSIGLCVQNYFNVDQVFNSSIFSYPTVFDFRQVSIRSHICINWLYSILYCLTDHDYFIQPGE